MMFVSPIPAIISSSPPAVAPLAAGWWRCSLLPLGHVSLLLLLGEGFFSKHNVAFGHSAAPVGHSRLHSVFVNLGLDASFARRRLFRDQNRFPAGEHLSERDGRFSRQVSKHRI